MALRVAVAQAAPVPFDTAATWSRSPGWPAIRALREVIGLRFLRYQEGGDHYALEKRAGGPPLFGHGTHPSTTTFSARSRHGRGCRRAAVATLAGARAGAATFVVDALGDQPDANIANTACLSAAGTCTLRAAIQQANASFEADTVLLAVTGEIKLQSALPFIVTSLVLLGPGPDRLGVDGNNLASNILHLGRVSSLALELSGVRLHGSQKGGIGAAVAGFGSFRVQLSHCAIESNGGTGLRIDGSSTLLVDHCRFAQNGLSQTTQVPGASSISSDPPTTATRLAGGDCACTARALETTIAATAPPQMENRASPAIRIGAVDAHARAESSRTMSPLVGMLMAWVHRSRFMARLLSFPRASPPSTNE